MTELLGLPIIREIEGKEYKFAQLTQKVIDAYEQYISKSILDDIEKLKPLLNNEQYSYAICQFAERKAAGQYEIFGTVGRGFLTEEKHIVHWLWVFLSEHQRMLTKRKVAKLYDNNKDEMFKILVELVSKKNCPLEQD